VVEKSLLSSLAFCSIKKEEETATYVVVIKKLEEKEKTRKIKLDNFC